MTDPKDNKIIVGTNDGHEFTFEIDDAGWQRFSEKLTDIKKDSFAFLFVSGKSNSVFINIDKIVYVKNTSGGTEK